MSRILEKRGERVVDLVGVVFTVCAGASTEANAARCRASKWSASGGETPRYRNRWRMKVAAWGRSLIPDATGSPQRGEGGQRCWIGRCCRGRCPSCCAWSRPPPVCGWCGHLLKRRRAWPAIAELITCALAATAATVAFDYLARKVWMLFPDRLDLATYLWAGLAVFAVCLALTRIASRPRSATRHGGLSRRR